MPDLRDNFSTLDRLDPPDLWGRAKQGSQRAPVPDHGPGGANRAVTVFVAFAVFAAAGTFAWLALRPSATRPMGPLDAGMIATQISVGDEHACALMSDGTAKCWGEGHSGQLGIGSWENQTTPVTVSGLARDNEAVAAGGNSTCFLTAEGHVLCTGGLRLEGGRPVQRPVQIEDLSDVGSISSGSVHACAITQGGVLRCWGENPFGQLGDGTTQDRPGGADVVALSSVSAVVAGDNHTCALTSQGAVKCWGWNTNAQLGIGTNGPGRPHTKPIGVIGLSSGVSALSAGGDQTCAITTERAVKCWGWSGFGPYVNNLKPAVIPGLSNVIDISVGESHACALLKSGQVLCWGHNDSGQLGDGTTNSHRRPVPVRDLHPDITSIAAGGSETCALTRDGGVFCWGNNESGQLGDGTTKGSRIPVEVQGFGPGLAAAQERFTESGAWIAAAGEHTCALTARDGVQCWGDNRYGQLGDGSTKNRSTPVDVVGLDSGVIALAAGTGHTCALMTGGGVKCWGYNRGGIEAGRTGNGGGQLGDGSIKNSSTPVDVAGLSGIVAITAGDGHTCALIAEGGVKCWGEGGSGQLGNGSSSSDWSSAPVDVVGLSSGVKAISAGMAFTCALTTEGEVKCWGDNAGGQLGTGLEAPDDDSNIGEPALSAEPIDVSGLPPGITAISTGGLYACALTAEGGVKCWGFNSSGQMGNGIISTHELIPVDVSGLSSGVVGISTGDRRACALMLSGAVMCWGGSVAPAGADHPRNVPVRITGLPMNVVGIASADLHDCALTAENEVFCWADRGGNPLGQLGDGTTKTSKVPVKVLAFGGDRSSAPPPSGPPDTDPGREGLDRASIYQAVLRQHFTAAMTVKVYVERQVCVKQEIRQGKWCDPLSAEEESVLAATYPTLDIRLADRSDLKPISKAIFQEKIRAAIMRFGPVEPVRPGVVDVYGSDYCGGLCGTFADWRVVRSADGGWKVTGPADGVIGQS